MNFNGYKLTEKDEGKEYALILKTEEETRELGRKVAQSLAAGDVIALAGDLGAGKTALTKAIAEGLGVKEMITSPTFTLVQEYYDGRLPLYHFDVYRIGEPEEMYELGYEEYFFGQGICVVEWADLILDLIPEGSLFIQMDYGQAEDERICRIRRI